MKPCDKHWTMMRAAVEERGITHLIKTAQQNHAAIVDQLERTDAGRQPDAGAPRADEFDPLMSAYWMVMSRALEHGGLYLMHTPEGGGHYCPICEAIKHTPDSTPEATERHWIDGPADAALAQAAQLGLVQRN